MAGGLPSLDIRIPQWGGWEHWLLHVEDRIDSALSSSNWALNALLSPVRSFVGYTLHPLFAFGDFLWGWGIDIAHWVFDHVPDLGWDVLYAFASFWNFTTDYANFVAGILRNEASTLFNEAKNFATNAVNTGVSGLRTLIDDARGYATDLFWKGASYANGIVQGAIDRAEALVSAARDFASDLFWKSVQFADAGLHTAADALATAAGKLYEFAQAVEHRAADLAKKLADGALGLAEDAIDVLKRDVWDKIFGPFQSFLSNEWHWAFGLLKVLESAAEWLVWATFHLVPEVRDTYKALKQLATADIGDLARWGASVGAA